MMQELEKVWRKYPDLRLGQLIWMLTGKDDPFYVEDYTIMKSMLERKFEDAIHNTEGT